MSRAETPTKLPLATWARYMGLHPLHFEQVRVEGIDPHCNDIYFQHSWQTADHIAREDIAIAIREAEDKIEQALGYRLAPSWELDEWHKTIQPYRREFVNLNAADVKGFRQVVQADWGHFISGGIQAKTLIQANRAITYSDVDGDGYKELATVSVTTTVEDINEIAIFYPTKNGDDSWEIRPTNVSISGGVATITFRRELVVIEDLLEAFDIEDGEALGTNDTHFLTTVDVYRRYNDPQTQASFLWEPLADGICTSCNGTGCAVCSYSAQTGCLIVRSNPRSSMVGYYPADWNTTDLDFDAATWAVARIPDVVRLYYYAGLRDKSARYKSRMSQQWERTVAYFAAALLDRPPCDCGADVWRRWREDLTIISGDEDGRPYFRDPIGTLDNPFGTRRGEVEAWRRVRAAGPLLQAVYV